MTVKRVWCALLAVLLLSAIALGETAGELIPQVVMWGMSREAVERQVREEFKPVKVGKKQGLRRSGIEVDGYVLDAYYVFDVNMRTYYGLSKVTYLLSGSEKRSAAQLNEACDAFVRGMTRALGAPTSAQKAKTTWQMERYKIEIGKGKFKSYTGSEDSNVAIVISGENIPIPTAVPTPTPWATATPRPTQTPRPAKKASTKSKQSDSGNYVLNTHTHKFHYPSCWDVERIKAGNRQDVYDSRSHILSMGYSPCGHCNP